MNARGVVAALLVSLAAASPDPGFVCIGCTIIKSLALEGAFNASTNPLRCPETAISATCDAELAALFSAPAPGDSQNPDEICKAAGFCTNEVVSTL